MNKFFTICLFCMILLCEKGWAQNKVVFIVNEANPLSRISQNQIRDFFLKRSREWPDGVAARFFDRTDGSQLRRKFLDTFIKKTPRQVDQYWIGQKLYSGESAPTQVASDRMVCTLVARFPGGIGYISAGSPIPKGTKVIEVHGD